MVNIRSALFRIFCYPYKAAVQQLVITVKDQVIQVGFRSVPSFIVLVEQASKRSWNAASTSNRFAVDHCFGRGSTVGDAKIKLVKAVTLMDLAKPVCSFAESFRRVE